MKIIVAHCKNITILTHFLLSVCPQQMIIFCNCSCPLPDDKKELPLTRQFQHAITCPQQIKIGKDIEV